MIEIEDMLLRLSKCSESEHHKMYQAIGQLCPCCDHRQLRYQLHAQVMAQIHTAWHEKSPSGIAVGLFKRKRMRSLEETITFFQEIGIANDREESERLTQAFQSYDNREAVRNYKLRGMQVGEKIGFILKET